MDTLRIGTIDYEVAANFIPANSNSLKMRRAAAARPHRIAQSGTQVDVRQVDMALKMVSKRTDVNRDNSIDSGDVMAVYSIMAGN